MPVLPAAPPAAVGRLSGGRAGHHTGSRTPPADRPRAGGRDQRAVAGRAGLGPPVAGRAAPATGLATPARRAGVRPKRLDHPAPRPCRGRAWPPAPRGAGRPTPFGGAPARRYLTRRRE